MARARKADALVSAMTWRYRDASLSTALQIGTKVAKDEKWG